MDQMYLSVKEAAKLVGIGENTMREFVNSKCPPPHIKLGRKVLIRRSALATYFEEMEQK